MKKLLFLIASVAWAAGTYQVERSSSLTSSVEAITVQMPASATRSAGMVGASVYCSAACVITIERDGTAASSTALTPAKSNALDAAVVATAYRSSNVGTNGRTVGRQVIGAGATGVFDLTPHVLYAGENLTIRTDSITATVIVNIQWRE